MESLRAHSRCRGLKVVPSCSWAGTSYLLVQTLCTRTALQTDRRHYHADSQSYCTIGEKRDFFAAGKWSSHSELSDSCVAVMDIVIGNLCRAAEATSWCHFVCSSFSQPARIGFSDRKWRRVDNSRYGGRASRGWLETRQELVRSSSINDDHFMLRSCYYCPAANATLSPKSIIPVSP